MTGAPPVTHAIGRTPQLAVLLGGLWASGAAAVTLALAWAPPLPLWKLALLLGAPLLTGAALLRWWSAQRPRRLVWDGAQWRLDSGAGQGADGSAVRLRVQLDLQRALLLHARPLDSGPGLWLWAQAGTDAARWHLLRCAVHADAPVADAAADAGEGTHA